MALGDAAQGAAAGASFGPWGAAIGGGIGLLSARQKEKAAREQMAMEAIQNALSPWTRMGLTPLQTATGADHLGSAYQGAIGGWGMGQSIDKGNTEATERFLDREQKKQRDALEMEKTRIEIENARRQQEPPSILSQPQQYSPRDKYLQSGWMIA